MQDLAVPRQSPPLHLRPRVGLHVIRAILACLAIWVLITMVQESDTVPLLDSITHPFLAAVIVVGIPFSVWFLWVQSRCGFRLDETGLFDLHSRTAIRWEEITNLELLGQNIVLRSQPVGLRFVQISAADGRSIRFADLGLMGRRWVNTRAGRVYDVEHSGLLLGIIADRTRASSIFPPQWKGIPVARPSSAAPKVVPVVPSVTPVGETDASSASTTASQADLPSLSGKHHALSPSLLKQMAKAGALLAVGVKAIKPAYLLVSFILYGIVFGGKWELGALIVLMIGFHECGHVYAMWRCGVPVKGIYFIPFLGAAAVSQGLAKTRWGNAFIQINGPIYGTVLALLCYAGYKLTGDRYPLLALATGWGALVNLFNLLPILPLDGGRLLGEISHSLHGTVGRYAVVSSLALGAGIAYWADLTLLWIMVAVGVLEFSRQLAVASQRILVEWLEDRRPISFEVNEHFGKWARPISRPPSPQQWENLRNQFEMLLSEARLVPMTGRQTTVVAVGYLILAVTLVMVLWSVSHIPGAEHAFNILRSD